VEVTLFPSRAIIKTDQRRQELPSSNTNSRTKQRTNSSNVILVMLSGMPPETQALITAFTSGGVRLY